MRILLISFSGEPLAVLKSYLVGQLDYHISTTRDQGNIAQQGSLKSTALVQVMLLVIEEVAMFENDDGVKEHPCPEQAVHCLKTIEQHHQR